MKPPLKKFQSLLSRRTITELLAAGKVLNVQGFADRLGYERQHVYRLIRKGRLAPIQRGAGWGRFFFLPEQVNSVFHRAER